MVDAEKALGTCFVIQEFDNGGVFDSRFAEIVRPAIEKAKLKPLRADEILGVNPVIEKIEDAIRKATVCLAEVSTNNENVWLELGFALALNKRCLIICKRSMRPRLPFDIHHRPVIFYSTETRTGFDKLESDITKNLEAELAKARRESKQAEAPNKASPAKLEEYEIAILRSLLVSKVKSPEAASGFQLEQALAKNGYSEEALGMGIASLLSKGLLSREALEDWNGDQYYAYDLTPQGREWASENRTNLIPKELLVPDFPDEIPF